MSNHTASLSSIEVYFKSPDTFYIRENGRSYPASTEHTVRRFGFPFVEAVVSAPAQWIDFDGTAADRFPALAELSPVLTQVAV